MKKRSMILGAVCIASLASLASCGKNKSETYADVTYSWSSDYKTCTATKECTSNSKKTKTETVDTVYSLTTAATCTAYEKGKYTATFSGKDFTTQTKDYTGTTYKDHELEDVAKVDATCTTAGHEAGRECKNCDYTEGEATIAALGHTYSYKGVCSVCNDENVCDYDTTKAITKNYVKFTAATGKYQITNDGAEQVSGIKLYDSEGNATNISWTTQFSTTEGVYYIYFPSLGFVNGKIENVSHTHSYNYTGACIVDGCDSNKLQTKTATDNLYASGSYGTMYYFKVTGVAAGTYMVKWAASMPSAVTVYSETGTALLTFDNATQTVDDFRAMTFTLTAESNIYINVAAGSGTQYVYLSAVTE